MKCTCCSGVIDPWCIVHGDKYEESCDETGLVCWEELSPGVWQLHGSVTSSTQ